ncbi:MAG: hypothetical protein FJ005_07415 [Chloroflexi bacterium]|nr:hypothetical protein [Chloroflexota bacterium]
MDPTSLWMVGDVGESIGFWVLHKCKFRRIVKPLVLQYREKDRIKTISHFISPNQIRQGICFLPSEDESLYWNKVLTEEQKKYHFIRWDFLALKVQRESRKLIAYPCLIEVKTRRSGTKISRDYESFKKRDFTREKCLGFRVFCASIILHDDWNFEADIEEL